MSVYTERHNEIISQAVDTIKGIGEGIKNAFMGFVYNADGSVSSAFATALSYIILAVSICVVVTLICAIFKIRRSI